MTIEQLLVEMRARIYSEAQRSGKPKIRQRYDTSDVTQETWIQIWKHLEAEGLIEEQDQGQSEVDGEHSSNETISRGLLYRITSNQQDKLTRRHLAAKRSVNAEKLMKAAQKSETGDPQRIAGQRDLIERLFSAMESLTQSQQQIVLRRIYNDESFVAIAREMNSAEHTVRREYARALTILKSRFGDV